MELPSQFIDNARNGVNAVVDISLVYLNFFPLDCVPTRAQPIERFSFCESDNACCLKVPDLSNTIHQFIESENCRVCF